MDPESKKILQDTFDLVSENNKILRNMRRAQRIASVMRILYWIVILGIAYGSYVFLTPYMDKAVQIINTSQDSLNSIKNILPK